MKFAISLEQRDHLRKRGIVPFSGLLTPLELERLNEGIEEVLADLKKARGSDLSPFERDLWRRSDKVKKIVFSRRLAELAFELLQKKPLRLAFDQLFPEKDLYSGGASMASFYGDQLSLQAHSCIKGLLGAFFLCVKHRPPLSGLSMEPGDGFFLLPSTPISLELLEGASECRFFAIGYADFFSQYLHELRDPGVHFLKSLGYVFGDRLNDRLHPILLR